MDESSSCVQGSLQKILGELDRFSTVQNRQNLLFLARAFTSLDELERLPQECLSARIKDILCRRASTGKALGILQRTLFFAKYDPARVDKLSRYLGGATFSQSLTPSSAISSKLSFHELLLIVSRKIDGNENGTPILQHLLARTPEADIGSAKQEVTSAMHLFTCMLTSGVLTPTNPSTLNSEVTAPLCSLRSKDEEVQIIVADIVDVMEKNVQVGQDGGIELLENVQDNDPGLRFSKRKCTKCTCVGTVIALLLIAVLIALGIVLVVRCTSELHMKEMKQQTIRTIRSFTFLALGLPISAHHCGELEFEVEVLSDPVQWTLTTCSTPCNQLSTAIIANTGTYNISGCESTRSNDKCFVQFNVSSDDRTETSIFIKRGSNFTIEVDLGDHENGTASLYLFYDTMFCDRTSGIPSYSYIGRNHKAGPIEFNRWENAYSHQVENDTFICAYWTSPASFQYTVQRHFTHYVVGANLSCDKSSTTSESKNISAPVKGYSKSQCVLANFTMGDGKVNMNMRPVEARLRKRLRECLLYDNIAITSVIALILILLCAHFSVVIMVHHWCSHRYRYRYRYNKQYQRL